MPDGQANGRTGLVTLNTRGFPLLGTGRAGRHACIGAAVEESGAGIACFQEVYTWYHLKTLVRSMPSFCSAAYRWTPAGPAGGLLVLSRSPAEVAAYKRLPTAPTAGLPLRSRLGAVLAGVLVARIAELYVVNVHPVANQDGDWSASSRYRPLQQAQLTAVARLVSGLPGPVVVCGDFNVARDSELFEGFLTTSGVTDAFNGTCPPTFRPEYLRAGRQPRCIDFILTGGPVKAEHASVMFGGTPHVSDHLGLHVELYAAPLVLLA